MKRVAELDEEARGLSRRIVQGLAYRELVLANIRGQGIKLLPEVAEKRKLVEELEHALAQFSEVEALYAALGLQDAASAVRDRMDRIPYPTSRIELALCLFLCQKTERAALAAYADSDCAELAGLCRTYLESTPAQSMPDDPVFVEFCTEPTNRPLAQQLFNRWLGIGLVALGRPGSRGDARAVALGLRSRTVEAIVREFLADLQPFLERSFLVLPEAGALGIELPASARTR